MGKKKLISAICEVIADGSDFSLDEIHDAYKKLNSFDRLLDAIQLSIEEHLSLDEVVQNGVLKGGSVSEVLRGSMPYSPSAGKSSINLGFKIKGR